MKYQIPFGCEGYPGTVYYLNLTNGLEALENFYFSNLDFIRIQSTKLEQHLLEDVLMDLDYDFLMHLALGYRVRIYDFSIKKTSRAMWQGVKWIEYVLNKIWFNRKIKIERGMHIYFEEKYKELSKKARKKIKYFRKFLKTDHLDIGVICEATQFDGDYDYYSSVLDKWLEGSISYG